MSRLFVRLICSGSRFNLPIISDIHPFSIVFGPFLFCLRVSWYEGPIRMMNIQEVDEQELSRQICFNMLGA